MPVYINEPINILQRFCEVWAYKDQLKKANLEKNEFKRIAYVISLCFMNLSQNIGRRKKPFNPLLGETHEYLEGDLRVISEQVSHHPPISAMFAENSHFQMWCFVEPITKFRLTKLEVSPRNSIIVWLKATKEKYVINRPKTSVHNVFRGTTYLWNFGEMSCVNITTGSKAVLRLKNHTMWRKLDYTCEGEIINAKGIFCFLNKSVHALMSQSG